MTTAPVRWAVLALFLLAGCIDVNGSIEDPPQISSKEAMHLLEQASENMLVLIAMGSNDSSLDSVRSALEPVPNDSTPLDGLAPAWVAVVDSDGAYKKVIQVFPDRLVPQPKLTARAAVPNEGWPNDIWSSEAAIQQAIDALPHPRTTWASTQAIFGAHIEGSYNLFSGITFTIEPSWNFRFVPHDGIVYEVKVNATNGNLLSVEPLRSYQVLLDEDFQDTDPLGSTNTTRTHPFDVPPLSNQLQVTVTPDLLNNTAGRNPYRFELQRPDGTTVEQLPTEQVPGAEAWRIHEPLSGIWVLRETHAPNSAVPVAYSLHASAQVPVVTQPS